MEQNKNNKTSLLSRLFGNRNKERNFMEEEQVQSPGKLVLRNFFHNPLGMAGLIVFLLIFGFVMIAPHFIVLDLSFQDNTQANVPPTMKLMEIPQELKGQVSDIAPGTTFGVGVSDTGKVHTWGYTKITDTIDLANIPEEVENTKIVKVATGYDHIVALDENGGIYVWGNERLGQARLPQEIKNAMRKNENLNFTQIEAGYQFSAAVTEDGQLFLWGNSNMADLKLRKEYEGQVKKVALTTYSYIVLLKDGSVVYGGLQKNAFSAVPETVASGIVDISATGSTVAAVSEDGTITVWGNVINGENEVPAMESKPVKLYGGLNHYTALMENGDVVTWGNNTHNVTDVPASVQNAEIVDIFSGFYQNYALTAQGDVETWGLKGYLFGTDDMGRDLLNRIANGGRVTMTVGAIAVIISLIIGIVLGGLAGYFGGWIDMLIMRVAEVVGGLPFLPFAMILSAIIGTRISVEQRMYLIMVVLGVLSWPGTCRLIRAQILSQREQEFVIAAKAMGVKEGAIVFRHILPNVLSMILVTATLDFATCMLTESTLSYLGFGISAPTPTWGNMLTSANNSVVIQQFWWRWVFPATIFGICTVCINLIGDALRSAFDPKSAER
ncbi:MAG: ABC transporter permease subunit [Lachnospiraceae bacterium]|nr:ABC transporter permease subunit [Lachnospiraceae bacterium]